MLNVTSDKNILQVACLLLRHCIWFSKGPKRFVRLKEFFEGHLFHQCSDLICSTKSLQLCMMMTTKNKNINPKTKQSKNASSSENVTFSHLLSPFHKTFSSLLKPHLPHIQKTKTRKQTNKQNQGSHEAVPTTASDALCGITGRWWKVRSESVKDSKCWSTLIFAWAHWQFDTQLGKGISFV